ncbi:MAG TPA: hypothetical protein VLA41_06200 [Burkholderiales bacterium]|nr:hypothetical protein [Burkholderiales bacterium]
MPINLEPKDVSADLAHISSVLIVYCPVCPQISLAMQADSPWIELLKSGLKTGALEEHIKDIRTSLEQRGVRSDVFTMRLPLPTMCLWTKGQRDRLLKRAEGYEAVLVMGCDSARYTAQQTLRRRACRLVQGMKMIGITNATVRYRIPMTFELRDKTRVQINQTGGYRRDE